MLGVSVHTSTTSLSGVTEVSQSRTINGVSWAAYALFVGVAIYAHGDAGTFSIQTDMASVKFLIWGTWLGFTGYTVYCSSRESLFATVARMSRLHWGRQIGADLYLGLLLALLVIYLHQGALVAALWTLPTLAFGNLSILLYFALNFDSLVARFVGG